MTNLESWKLGHCDKFIKKNIENYQTEEQNKKMAARPQ